MAYELESKHRRQHSCLMRTAKLMTPMASKTLGFMTAKTSSDVPRSSGGAVTPLTTTEKTMISIETKAAYGKRECQRPVDIPNPEALESLAISR